MATQSIIGWRRYVDSGLDTSATAFFTATGLTDLTQRSAINTLVKDLKRFGLWTKLKAFYPFVGGSAASHKFNLLDPRDLNEAYRLTFSGGWTHNSLGAQCNGTNATSNTYLSLNTTFGATSYEHNLGIYINYNNPSWSYLNDIGAVDGAYNTNPNISLSYDTNSVYAYNLRGNRQYPDLVFSKTLSPSGLTEFKRFRKGYFCLYKNGFELLEGSVINTYRSISYDATFYNPVSSVYIGSSVSFSRYAAAYVSEAFGAVESYLMYISIQKYQTALGRQVGTAISAISTVPASNSTLVTDSLKINLDTNTLSMPAERTLVSSVPGNYFRNGDVWTDTSGQGNNGIFEKISIDSQDRIGEYWKNDDFGTVEIRMRDYNGLGNGQGLKQYQSGSSPDAIYTTYKGSATGTFTFGGWIKGNSNFSGPFFSRGNYANTTGWGCSISIGGVVGSKFSVSNINSTNGGTTGVTTPSNQTVLSSITTMQSDVWYLVYCVWKPSSYVKIYVNGQLETTTAITYADLRTHNNNIYGFTMNMTNKDVTWGYGRGIYGAMHVYDRELSSAEIMQNFNAQRSKYNLSATTSIDQDALAFVTAASITSSTQISAINTLVSSMKTAGVWTKLKAIYPFIGGTATSHKFNLKDPRDLDAAYRLVFSGGWTHSSNGAQPNGTTGYATTKLSPSSILTTNNTHLSFYSRTSTYSAGQRDISIFQGGGNPSFTIGTDWLPSYTASGLMSDQYSSSQRFVSTIIDGSGLMMANRSSSTSHKLFRNGSLLATDTTLNTSTLPSGHLYMGAASLESTPGSFIGAAGYSNKQYAFTSIGDGLTDAESTELYNIVQTYQTTLGRQV